jgi:iron-sulfur cluster repair protein YtfE (RIC family)
MNITPETRVAEIAAHNPATIRIFQRFTIDFCCGGKRPLAEVCAERLVHLRELTAGYAPPPDACNTFRGLYHGLAELERALHEHIHLENNVLFPRAARLEEKLVSPAVA